MAEDKMGNQPGDFEQFLKQREEASRAWVNGDAKPLERITTHQSPASFLGPGGGYERGSETVLAAYREGAAHFESGETTFEVIGMEAGEGLAYVTGIQHATITAKGKSKAEPMDLRITEVFRQENGEWKLVHRHADMSAAKADTAKK
jgi:ketosteroid isomerase-like protein